MSLQGSDLVQDSQLQVKILEDRTIHYVRDKSSTERLAIIEQTWHRVRKVGHGGFGVVWLESCTSGNAKKIRAVKELKTVKENGSHVNYIRELEAVAKFSHEKYNHLFVQSYGWYAAEQSVFITMEYLEHGDLQQYIRKTPLKEHEARVISQQILEGLESMHRSNFVHRDMKPANVLVHRIAPQWWIKIADFGISKRAETAAPWTSIGTPGYTAPEVMGLIPSSKLGGGRSREYSSAIDIWAVGIIAFRMMTAKPAFEDHQDRGEYVRSASFPKYTSRHSLMSPGCLSFIKRCISPSPSDRPSAEHALRDPWIQSGVETSPMNSGGYGNQSETSTYQSAVPEPSASWDTSSGAPENSPSGQFSAAAAEDTFDTFKDLSVSTSPTSASNTSNKSFWLAESLFQLTQEIECLGLLGISFAPRARGMFGDDEPEAFATTYDKGLELWRKYPGSNVFKKGDVPDEPQKDWPQSARSFPAFSNDGSMLAVSFPSVRNISLYAVAFGAAAQMQPVQFPESLYPREVHFSPTREYMIVGVSDNTLRVYKWERVIYIHKQTVRVKGNGSQSIGKALAFAKFNDRFVWGSADAIRIWDLAGEKFKLSQKIELARSEIECITIDNMGDNIFAIADARVYHLSHRSDGNFQTSASVQHGRESIQSLHLTPDGQIVMLSDGDAISLPADFQENQTERPKAIDAGFRISRVIVSDCGKLVALYRRTDSKLCIYETGLFLNSD